MEWKTLQELLTTGEYEELRPQNYETLNKIVNTFLSKESWTIKEMKAAGLNFEVDRGYYYGYKCKLTSKNDSSLRIYLSNYEKVEGEYVDPFTKKKGHNWHYVFYLKDVASIKWNKPHLIRTQMEELVNECKRIIKQSRETLKEKHLICNDKELYKTNGNNKEIEVKELWEEIGDFNLEGDNVITLYERGIINRSTAQSLLNRIKKGYSGIVSVGLFDGEEEKIKEQITTNKKRMAEIESSKTYQYLLANVEAW